MIGKEFNDPGVSSGLIHGGANYQIAPDPDAVYQNTTFAKQPAYCINYGFVDSTTFKLVNIPKDIALGGCYILDGNRFYYIQVMDNTPGLSNPPKNVNIDKAEVIRTLKSISFK